MILRPSIVSANLQMMSRWRQKRWVYGGFVSRKGNEELMQQRGFEEFPIAPYPLDMTNNVSVPWPSMVKRTRRAWF